MSYLKKYRERVLLLFITLPVIMFMLSFFIIPVPQFDSPTCTILESKNGSLLAARIAEDGQWRFPILDSIPHKFETCILHFEDRSFYHHYGVDPKGILRAIRENYRAGKVVQGGSTLTMQVARMMGNGQRRSVWNKLRETVLALHLEVNLSKKDILRSYCSHAPFGGNVVGLETAAWRYYGRSPEELSWAESATLAVLPNAPSLIYPGKGQEQLLAKRDRLLASMKDEGLISEEEFDLAKLEDLPQKPERMPDYAMHLMDRFKADQGGKRIRTNVDHDLQKKAQFALNSHVQGMESIEVYNGALIILDTKSQEVKAYVGNSNYNSQHANAVDCASAPRSSGSILKPLLFAAMIDAGELTPDQLIEDVPTQIAEYSPENYYGDYDGVVPASEALYRSLNIPFVRLLKEYGVARFQKDLKGLGLSSLNRSPDSYGLSLMLGGAEVRLDELTDLYAKMGASLSEFDQEYPFKRWSIYHTFKALRELTRPEGREYQRSFSGQRELAWKTGTSFGNKDAWAIGVTPDYTIGVWVGNADGEGRSGLTGVSCAAPLLFDILDLLPGGEWFNPPLEGGTIMDLCSVSGHLAGNSCPQLKQVELPAADYSEVGLCTYHRTLMVTKDRAYYGRLGCAGTIDLEPESWFILKPIEELYYKVKHTDYRSLPLLIEGCKNNGGQMEFIYPNPDQKIYIPKDLDGRASKVIAKLAHRNQAKEVYWYVDDKYLGASFGIHEMPIYVGFGKHRLFVLDDSGAELDLYFEVLSVD